MERRSVGRAELRFTDAGDGDLRTSAAARAAIHPGPWTRLRQVHGGHVVVVDRPGDRADEEADAAVTRALDAPLVVMTADCAPVALVSGGGDVVGVAHAGWRGLAAGVLGRTVDAMHALGASGPLTAVLGPCIHAECYEFGAADLDRVAAMLGDGVRGVTKDGRPALDVVAAVRSSLRHAGVDDLDVIDVCTSCAAGTYWSHRARGDVERQGVVAWRSAPRS